MVSLSHDQKRAFLEEYLAALKTTSVHGDINPKVNTVEHLLQETETFTMASHIFWSLWALNSAHSSKINFGYWEYGAARLKRYERRIEMPKDFEFPLRPTLTSLNGGHPWKLISLCVSVPADTSS